MIHLIEIEEGRPREGEMVRTKCGKKLAFRPFSPTLNKMLFICSECDTRGPTKIPNFLSVLETSLLKTAGA